MIDINVECAVNDIDDITPKTYKIITQKLKGSTDWPHWWSKVEFLQLDQYETQERFSPPYTLPPNTNALHLL